MGTKWTEKDLAKLGVKVPKHSGAVKVPKSVPTGVQFIKNTLTLLKVDFIQEHRFDSIRQFRFDFAIPASMIAIEYEGLMSEKSGHTTINGYTNNCEKYNLAAKQGWTLLRYTAKNYKQFEQDIDTLLQKL